jgi:cytosine/adenosine deaminase-related metal-dependent hydrolase
MADYSLKNGIVVTANKNPGLGAVQVRGSTLAPLGPGVAMDLGEGSFVYPALINTHDHMRGNYLPRVGPKPGTFYLTWLPWDNDLKASSVFRERSKIPAGDLYFFSAYKNLFSGVTTVHDHFPPSFNRDILPTLPIRALLNYGLAHEATSYDLKWGDGIEAEHRRAVVNNWPFITHLSEGFDEESMGGVETLERLGVLDNHCLLVHGIGFSDEDIRKIARAGASVSWCPASNMFMFNVTCKIRKLLRAGVNVTIGTDSTHTGSRNLLAEIRFARELYRKLYGEELPGRTIFEMVTCNAARAFRLGDSLGSLDEGKLADILVLKARKDDPYENLVSASMSDVQLLTMDGKPVYGELRFIELLGGSLPRGYTRITVRNRPMFIVGDPASLYRMARERVGFKKNLDFLPFEPELDQDHYA